MDSSEPTYDVICPYCKNKAIGHTQEDGTWGSFRNCFRKYTVIKITCINCGKISNCVSKQPKLWYYTELDGVAIWEYNASRLLNLYDFLRFDSSEHQYYRDYLPKQILSEPTRSKAIKWIETQLD